MLTRWPIRVKFLIGLGLLLLLMGILSFSGIYAGTAYRDLVKNLSWRAIELPLAATLSRQVGELRITLSELRGLQANCFPDSASRELPTRHWWVRDQFHVELAQVEETLSKYRKQLEHKIKDGSPIADNQREWATVWKIEAALREIRRADRDEDWFFDEVCVGELGGQLDRLQILAAELPSHLHRKLAGFTGEVRATYRTLIIGTWVASILVVLLFGLFLKLFHQWISRPLGILVEGSREVAAGNFSYRLHLDSDDEMAELADAMNDMTARFRAIRDDLDRQVQIRTGQVVRSEQLASVGFLAAGVAHEINNPLASISMCAESLEGRIRDTLDPANADHAVVGNYLRMIQDEAFRCKEITGKLLDFSRVGPVERRNTDLAELVSGVVEMVRHVGTYHAMNVEFHAPGPAIAPVNPQEYKQIVLNLLTNALDSLDPGGAVRVRVARRNGFAELVVADNGCGMEPEVLKHIFEPFFTRRRGGQGTGLGLSITHRIVSDHGGEIEAHSDGPGRGSVFRVRMPLAETTKETDHQYHRAA